MTEKLTDEQIAAIRDGYCIPVSLTLSSLMTEVLESRAALDAKDATIDWLTKDRGVAVGALKRVADDAASSLDKANARTSELEAQLKTVLNRESASQARHDERVAKLEAEIERLRADAAAGWDKCEERRLETLEAAARILEVEAEIEQLRARLAEEPRPPVLDDVRVFDPGRMPEGFSREDAQAALSDYSQLWRAFLWVTTKQGCEFWEEQTHFGLTDEGRRIIEHWLVETEKDQHAS